MQDENCIEHELRVSKQARPAKILKILFVWVSLPLMGVVHRFVIQFLDGFFFPYWVLGATAWFAAWGYIIWELTNWDTVKDDVVEAQEVEQERKERIKARDEWTHRCVTLEPGDLEKYGEEPPDQEEELTDDEIRLAQWEEWAEQSWSQDDEVKGADGD